MTSSSYSQNTFPSSGNVGIGIGAPSDPLDVNISNVEPKGVALFTNGSGNPVLSPVGGIRFSWYTTNFADIQMVRNNSSNDGLGLAFLTSSSNSGLTNERMRIDQQGNIGIGTVAPHSLLSIQQHADPILGSDGIGALRLYNTAGTTFAQLQVNTSGIELSSSGSTSLPLFLNINRAAVPPLTIGTNGFVGLGTITPKEQLSVNGNIRAKQVKVEVANWPDYVFFSSYHLLPLQDLETYIEKNHHLPEIPSSKEVESEGINLGQINRVLTKKVEELTLFLINENKEITDLKSKEVINKKLYDKQMTLLIQKIIDLENKINKSAKDPSSNQ